MKNIKIFFLRVGFVTLMWLRIYKIWSKVFRFIWQRKYDKYPIAKYSSFEELYNVIKTCTYVPDDYKAMWDAFSSIGYIQNAIDNDPKRKIGDCLPFYTNLLTDKKELIPISEICVGDKIYDGNTVSVVINKWDRGEKPVIGFKLKNGHVFFCTENHQVQACRYIDTEDGYDRYIEYDDDDYVRYKPIPVPKAKDVEVGDFFRTTIEGTDNTKVIEIFDAGIEHVYDIQTESGTIFLPDSYVIVHNCDEHALYESSVIKSSIESNSWTDQPIKSTKILTVRWIDHDGKSNGHNVCLVEFVDGKFTFMDYFYPERRFSNIEDVKNAIVTDHAGTECVGWAVSSTDLDLLEIHYK